MLVEELSDKYFAEINDIWNDVCIPLCTAPEYLFGFCFLLAQDKTQFNCTSCIANAKMFSIDAV